MRGYVKQAACVAAGMWDIVELRAWLGAGLFGT